MTGKLGQVVLRAASALLCRTPEPHSAEPLTKVAHIASGFV
jgi:hypothetical protein